MIQRPTIPRPSPVLALIVALALPATLVLPTAGGVRIVDGDTIDVGYRVAVLANRYRLTGFDAPEIRKAKCKVERAAGKAAGVQLEAAMAGKTVSLSTLAARDQWGRFLATLYIDDEDVAGIAVRGGWGAPTTAVSAPVGAARAAAPNTWPSTPETQKIPAAGSRGGEPTAGRARAVPGADAKWASEAPTDVPAETPRGREMLRAAMGERARWRAA